MSYTHADAEAIAQRIEDAQERVERFTIEIETARKRGENTRDAEVILVSMLTSLQHMIAHAGLIRADLDPSPERGVQAL